MSEPMTEKNVTERLRHEIETMLAETLSLPLKVTISGMLMRGVPEDVVRGAIRRLCDGPPGGALDYLRLQCECHIMRVMISVRGKGEEHGG